MADCHSAANNEGASPGCDVSGRQELASAFLQAPQHQCAAQDQCQDVGAVGDCAAAILYGPTHACTTYVQLEGPEEEDAPGHEEVEEEPEDINPNLEEEARQGAQAPLDSEDDASETDELSTLEDTMPHLFRVAPPPLAEVLEFKNIKGKDLKEKLILYNWCAIGWCQGRIQRQSGDKGKMVKVDGEKHPANFVVVWSDGEVGPVCFTLGKYGEGPLREPERWVLLELDTE